MMLDGLQTSKQHNMEQSYEYPDCGRQQRLGFWLLPFNKAAAALVSCHPHNLERYSYDEDTRGMWIDFSNPEKQEYTVGCSDSVDIYLPQVWNSTGSSGISERHASFRAVTDSGPVLLCDESEYLSTEPFSHGSHSYTVNFRREGRERSVLVAQGINSLIAFGHGRFYQFELRWENDGLDEFRMEPPVLYALGPSRTKTKSYVLGEKVGGGTFGNVYRAMQVTTGSVMAVKKFNRLSSKRLNFASREITTLLKINSNESTRCDHIIHILGYTTGPDWAEIFLPLKSGTLKTLVSNILPPSSRFQLSNLVLHQMLLALHHLDQHNIIHRDLNPENILWDHHFPSETGSYHFTLADFGLSISTSSRASRVKAVAEVAEIAGTRPFMAPEMYNNNNRQISSKVDIWSLFATIVWVRDKRFRKGCELVGPHLVHVWLNRIAGNKSGEGGYEAIKRMACFDPRRRPSAGEQLEQLEMEEAEMEEMELEMEEMGLGGEEGLGEYALEMPYYWHEETYMTDAVGDYEWDGTDGAWLSEGYALPVEVTRDGEEWMPGHDGHYSLAKSTRDKADAAMAMWKDWYLATNG